MLTRLEAKTPALLNHAAAAGASHDTRRKLPAQPVSAAEHRTPRPAAIPATHGTGRGASFDRRGGRFWLSLRRTD
jgi:hypothetical protein